MKTLKLDDFVDTFDDLKLDELVKALRFLSSIDGFEDGSDKCDNCERKDVKMSLGEIDNAVELAADLIKRSAFASLTRYSYLFTAAVIRHYERKLHPLDTFVPFEPNVEFPGQDGEVTKKN